VSAPRSPDHATLRTGCADRTVFNTLRVELWVGNGSTARATTWLLHIALPLLAAQLHVWLSTYICHGDELRLRHWIGRVTAAH
jgi:hypothetical protein